MLAPGIHEGKSCGGEFLERGEGKKDFLRLSREKVDAEKVGGGVSSGFATNSVQYTQTYMALCF